MPLSIAIYQFDAELGAVAQNLRRIEGILDDIVPGEVDVVAFPEMCDTGYAMDVIAARAVTWGDQHLQGIKVRARKKRVNVLLGLSERQGDRVYNAVAVIGKNGKLVYKYRKSHLVTIAPIHEERTISPGNELGYFELDGLPCGVMTCYELRFPEIARALTLRGIQLLFVPTAWPLVRLDHLLTLTRARAIENQLFVVLASRSGTDGETNFSGNTMVVDPWGKVLVSASENGEGMIRCAIALEEVLRCRTAIAALQERRPDLYE